MGHKHHSPETRARAIALLAESKTHGEVASAVGVKQATVASWALKAGLRRNKPYRVKRAAKGVTLKAEPKLRLSGAARVIAAIVTDPDLTDGQRVRMITAYLNAR